ATAIPTYQRTTGSVTMIDVGPWEDESGIGSPLAAAHAAAAAVRVAVGGPILSDGSQGPGVPDFGINPWSLGISGGCKMAAPPAPPSSSLQPAAATSLSLSLSLSPQQQQPHMHHSIAANPPGGASGATSGMMASFAAPHSCISPPPSHDAGDKRALSPSRQDGSSPHRLSNAMSLLRNRSGDLGHLDMIMSNDYWDGGDPLLGEGRLPSIADRFLMSIDATSTLQPGTSMTGAHGIQMQSMTPGPAGDAVIATAGGAGLARPSTVAVAVGQQHCVADGLQNTHMLQTAGSGDGMQEGCGACGGGGGGGKGLLGQDARMLMYE
ncbi:hypothetical protein VaNZ11_001366, partial [Volvox africanus]